MTRIGIDPSINSTGIVVVRDDGSFDAHVVTCKMTRSMRAVDESGRIRYHVYDKHDTTDKTKSFAEREREKMHNIDAIVDEIRTIVHAQKTDDSIAFIESNSYASASTSAIIELAWLNYAIRKMLDDECVRCVAVPPCANKRNAVGNGQADKDAIVYSFTTLFDSFAGLHVKLDDIADAYFLTLNNDE